MLRALRACWRLAMCTAHILLGAAICVAVFPFKTAAQRLDVVSWWCRTLLHQLGIRIDVHGTAYPGPVLLVANHVSWVDILAINAVRPARFVSKADVLSWPLLGWLVACGGTLFIERERKRDALRVVHQVAQALGEGDRIAVFPEGTTGDGHSLLPFHANLLQAAIATASPVQAMALAYRDALGAPSKAVIWVGNTTLVASLWSIAMADGLCVELSLLTPEQADGSDRRTLSNRLRQSIAEAIHADGAPLAAH